MNAVRPVLNHPTSEPTVDVNMGEHQEEFNTLPVTIVERHLPATSEYGEAAYYVSVSRWRLTDEERFLIAAGADIVHQVTHRPGSYPPMNLQIVFPNDDPQIVRRLDE